MKAEVKKINSVLTILPNFKLAFSEFKPSLKMITGYLVTSANKNYNGEKILITHLFSSVPTTSHHHCNSDENIQCVYVDADARIDWIERSLYV